MLSAIEIAKALHYAHEGAEEELKEYSLDQFTPEDIFQLGVMFAAEKIFRELTIKNSLVDRLQFMNVVRTNSPDGEKEYDDIL